MSDALCANCAGTQEVEKVTPDMDIAAVPLCKWCRVYLMTGQLDLFEARRKDSE